MKYHRQERSHSGLVQQFTKLPFGAIRPRVRISPSPLSPAEAQGAKEGFARVSADTVRHRNMYYVYVLHCVNNKPYVGCTYDLRERIERHKNGNVPATESLLPIALVAYFAFSNKYTAFNFERYLKSGSVRAFMKRHLYLDSSDSA